MIDPGHVPETPSEDVDFVAVADFRAALRRFESATDAITRRHGLTRRRYELLVMLAGRRDGTRTATVTQLARRLQLELHTTTEIVARAEHAGLVRRVIDSADRRATRVALTEEGEARLAAAAEALRPERDRLAVLLADVVRHVRLRGPGTF